MINFDKVAEFDRKRPWYISTYYFGTHVEELKEITKILIKTVDVPAEIRSGYLPKRVRCECNFDPL
jgi:hypothetical protein